MSLSGRGDVEVFLLTHEMMLDKTQPASITRWLSALYPVLSLFFSVFHPSCIREHEHGHSERLYQCLTRWPTWQ